MTYMMAIVNGWIVEGTGERFGTEQEAIQYAIDHGILVSRVNFRSTVRNGQELGDIIGVYDYSNGPTSTERDLFEIIPVKKVKKAEIDADFQSQLDPAKTYPKFPFTDKNLSATDKAKLDNGTLPIADIRTVIAKLKPKAPTGVVAIP